MSRTQRSDWETPEPSNDTESLADSGVRSLLVMLEQHLVVFPQGQPQDPENRDRCTQFALWCGGDVRRVIEMALKNRKGWTQKTTPSGAEYEINIIRSASEAPISIID